MLFLIWSQDLLQLWTTSTLKVRHYLFWPLLSSLVFSSPWLVTPMPASHQISSDTAAAGTGVPTKAWPVTQNITLHQTSATTRGSSTCAPHTSNGPQKHLLPADCSSLCKVLLCYQNLGYLETERSWQSDLWHWMALKIQSITLQKSYWTSAAIFTHYKLNTFTASFPTLPPASWVNFYFHQLSVAELQQLSHGQSLQKQFLTPQGLLFFVSFLIKGCNSVDKEDKWQRQWSAKSSPCKDPSYIFKREL